VEDPPEGGINGLLLLLSVIDMVLRGVM